MASLVDAADLQEREERFQRQEFNVRAVSGDIMAVDGPYYLWAYARHMQHDGFTPDQTAMGANHDQKLAALAPLSGWRAEAVKSILAHPALRTSLGVTTPAWHPRPRKACRDCGTVFVMDRADVVRCEECRAA